MCVPVVRVMMNFDSWRVDMLNRAKRIHVLESNLLTWAILNGRQLKDWETSDALS